MYVYNILRMHVNYKLLRTFITFSDVQYYHHIDYCDIIFHIVIMICYFNISTENYELYFMRLAACNTGISFNPLTRKILIKLLHRICKLFCFSRKL